MAQKRCMLKLPSRSQRTSKCGKNISDTLGCASCATFLFLPHFDVICDLLLNRRMATWNLFVKWNTLMMQANCLAKIVQLCWLARLQKIFGLHFNII